MPSANALSLGGIFGSDPGVLAADHMYHLLGSNDIAQVWRLLMPGRWPFFASSEWNRALRQRRVTIAPMPGMGHTGRGGYIDGKSPGNGRAPNVEITSRTIAYIIEAAVAGRPVMGSLQPGLVQNPSLESVP